MDAEPQTDGHDRACNYPGKLRVPFTCLKHPLAKMRIPVSPNGGWGREPGANASGSFHLWSFSHALWFGALL
jgi:hypothetical protein